MFLGKGVACGGLLLWLWLWLLRWRWARRRRLLLAVQMKVEAPAALDLAGPRSDGPVAIRPCQRRLRL
eukprot:COSAG01_NODE_7934_length_2985_cov_8.088011_5_plen_68_part_00